MKNIHTIFAISLSLAICLGSVGTVSAQSSGGTNQTMNNNTDFPLTNTTNATSSLEDIKNMSNVEGTTKLIK
jgi:hypothetical protein